MTIVTQRQFLCLSAQMVADIGAPVLGAVAAVLLALFAAAGREGMKLSILTSRSRSRATVCEASTACRERSKNTVSSAAPRPSRRVFSC